MDEIDVAVGRKIRLRRLALGLSQTAVAAALGLTFQQLQKYEKGVNRISASRLYALGQVLDVEPSHFFEDDARAATPEPVERFLLQDHDCVVMNRAFHRIRDPRVRRAIVALIQDIAAELPGE